VISSGLGSFLLLTYALGFYLLILAGKVYSTDIRITLS
jgi:hypothetical protein